MKGFLPAAALLISLGLAGQAAADDHVAIGFYFDANGIGKFVISGGSNAVGTAEVVDFSPYLDSHGHQRVKIKKVLHFAGGDVNLQTDGTLVSAADTQSAGTWEITSGTGTYHDVRGNGKYHWEMDNITGLTVGAYPGELKNR